jgi:hypothetical protein
MRRRSNSYNDIHVFQVLYVVRATSAKFDLYPGQMQAITQNEEGINIRIIVGIILLCIFPYNIFNKNILIIMETFYKKCSSQHRLRCRHI